MRNMYIKTLGYGLPDDFIKGQNELYKIQNKLLYACTSGCTITVEMGKQRIPVCGFRKNKLSTGYVFLCHLTKQALNIQHTSTYAERIESILLADKFCDKTFHGLKYALKNKTLLYQVTPEFNKMYQYVQEQLHLAFPKPGTTVKLKRFIGSSNFKNSRVSPNGVYATLLAKLVSCAQLLSLSTIEFQMDFINSYTHADENKFGSILAIHQDILLQDVLYCYPLVSQLPGYSSSEINSPGFSEENEWVVVNRSPTGTVSLPLECFEFFEDSYFNYHRVKTKEEAKLFMQKYDADAWQNALDSTNQNKPESIIKRLIGYFSNKS